MAWHKHTENFLAYDRIVFLHSKCDTNISSALTHPQTQEHTPHPPTQLICPCKIAHCIKLVEHSQPSKNAWMLLSYGSTPCTLTSRDPVYHTRELPNFQQLS